MATGGAALYLKKCMSGSSFEEHHVRHLGAHSFKVRLLAWSAMYGKLSVVDRRLMGHHVTWTPVLHPP